MATMIVNLSKKLLIMSLKHSLPQIVRLIFFLLWTEIIALVSIWRGMVSVTDDMATVWRNRFVDDGGPSFWEWVYPVCLVLAWITIIIGWVALSFTTVFIVRWIF